MRCRDWLAPVLLLSLLVLPVRAQTPALQLELLNESLTTPEQTHLGSALSYICELYRRLGLDPQPRIRARLFSTYADFDRYQRQQRRGADALNPSRLGYFNPGAGELVIWRSRRFTNIFIHESQHALLRSTLPAPPKWLNEGLSEYFEGIDTTATPPRVQPQGPRLRRLRRFLGHSDLGEQLVAVLSMSPRQFEARAERGLDSYTCSWALNYYLWSRSDGERLLGEVLRRTRDGEDSERVLEQVYPGGLAALREDLPSFYRHLVELSPAVSE